MRYLVRTPDGKLAVFDDTEEPNFEMWDIDPKDDADIRHIRHVQFLRMTPRIFHLETQHALEDLPVDLVDEAPHPERLGRFERAVGLMVEWTDSNHVRETLTKMGFDAYAIPQRFLDEEKAREARIAREIAARRAYASRPDPIVNSTKDETLWNEI